MAVRIHRELGNVANIEEIVSNLRDEHDLICGAIRSKRSNALTMHGSSATTAAARRTQLARIAGLRHALGEDEQALASFQEALKNDREVGDHLEESIATMNMGNVYMAQSHMQAIECFRQGYTLHQEERGKTRNWADELSFKAVALSALDDSRHRKRPSPTPLRHSALDG